MSDTKKPEEVQDGLDQGAVDNDLIDQGEPFEQKVNEQKANKSSETSDQETMDEAPQNEIDVLKEQVATLSEEAAKMKDAFVRAKAEEENVRRRAEKEVANSRKFAVEGFAKELLSVRDSLAIAANLELDCGIQDSVKGIKDGVDITLKQLDSAFAKFAIVEVDAKQGDTLDPNVHQAMSIVEAPDVKSGCIVNVIQSGFTMHERLLRPAMVIVAK